MKQVASFMLLQELQLVIRIKKTVFVLTKQFFRVYGMSPISNWALELKR